ncbi:MFS transporter [Isachenkonia alkalipeptolytica]|uniref:MFS transporter n=1 Tax=Isachenkonia alkalipeptolytica TaxID=2565777 RepID=A0AA43XL83_9CLOT|nr:MFS transporter [Isachenkonia alkalipeptolytica]NBG88702.1 MFS transporter [Isachenkonia alkalipeptolytica]
MKVNHLASEKLKDFKSFPRNIRLIFAVILLNNIAKGMFMTLYNLYLQEVGFNASFMGELISMTALASAIFLVPIGFLSDKIGRKKTMIIGIVFADILQILRAIILSSNTLVLLSFLLGGLNSFFMVANAPFLIENSSKAIRMKVFSINFALMIFSSMLGNIIGGVTPDILQGLSGMNVADAQRMTLILSTLLSLFALIPLLKIKEPEKVIEKGREKLWKSLKNIKNSAIILKFIFANALVGFGAGLFVPFSNLYFENQFQLPTSTIGLIMSLGQASTVIAILLGPYLSGRFGRVKTVFYLQILSVPFMLILGDTRILSLAIFAFLIRQAIMNASNPITSAVMLEEVPENLKGITNSLNHMVFQLGWTVCGRLSGIIIDNYGYDLIFYLAGGLYATSAVYYYLMFRHIDKRKAAPAVAKPEPA